MIKGSNYELSLEVKPSQIIFTIVMIIALVKMVSPEPQPDKGFKHSVENLKKMMTSIVIEKVEGL